MHVIQSLFKKCPSERSLSTAGFVRRLWAASFCCLATTPAWSQAPAAIPPEPTSVVLREIACEHAFIVLLGEEFAGRFVLDQHCDEGPYHDVVLDAVVDGQQSTNTQTRLDVLSAREAARMQLVLTGVTKNQSLAKTPQAAVAVEGNYHFRLTKQIEFDGTSLRTWSPAAYMLIQQRNVGAQTPVSMVPLLGPLANSVVLSVAQQRKPMAERIAAARVTESVAPQFNSRVDEGLTRLNQQLERGVRGWLTSKNLLPRRVAARSTDDAILFGASYRDGRLIPPTAGLRNNRGMSRELANSRVAQSLPAPLLAPIDEAPQVAPRPFEASLNWDSLPLPRMAMAAVHESLIGDLSSRTALAGLRISDNELTRFLNPGTEGDEGATGGLVDLIFNADQPVSTEFRNGEVLLTLRITFQPKIGPALPEQEIVVASVPVLEGANVRFPFELRSLRAVNGWPEETMRAMAEPILRQAISQRLKERTVPREFDIPRDEGRPPIPARIHSLTMQDGWLSVAVEPRPLPAVNLRPMHEVQAAMGGKP